MEARSYIISFGNSSKYRITPETGDLADIKKDVKDYLVKKFPQIKALDFYDKMTVEEITPENAAQYAGYKEFDADSIREIENVLSTEVEDARSLKELNSNAPWGIGAEK